MANSKINIMFIVASLSIGGAERQLIELMKGIDRGHFSPCIVFLDLPTTVMDDIGQLNIPIFYALRKWRWDPLVVFKLARLVRKYNICLLHTFMSMAGIYGSIVARIAGIPIVNSAIRHSRCPSTYERILLKPSFALSSVVLANSEAGREVFKSIAPAKIRVIHNGVDLRRFNKLVDRARKKADLNLTGFKFIVTQVARLEPWKNPMMFVRMAAIVLKCEQEVAFISVGGGSQTGLLESEIRNAGLENNIFLLGFRSDVEEILHITDVGVLTSNTEGLPNTVIEMLASGVPVVATDCGGTTEVLDSGKTGLLVECDDANGMAQQVLRLLRDEKLRDAMGAAGKQEVERRFSLNIMIEATEGIYRELMRSNMRQ
jgi:glycosyltransferase involved in cell wall biosynthesis